MNIGILGRGRLGRTLAPLWSRAGHQVQLRAHDQRCHEVDVLVLTVPEHALPQLAAALPRPGPVLLHCAGAATVEVLRPHRPAGSLHPLMTFPGPEIATPDLSDVPAAIDGDPEARAIATTLARDLGMRPLAISGDRRLYHAAAVMAGNHATVLLLEASRALQALGVSPAEAPALLAPLAIQSLRNAATDPAHALTGPAVRGEHDIIAQHQAALEGSGLAEVAALYRALNQATLRRATSDDSNPPPTIRREV